MKNDLGIYCPRDRLQYDERLSLMLVGQRFRCEGSKLSLVNFNRRGDKGGSIRKVLLDALTEFFITLIVLRDKDHFLEQVV